MKLCLAKDLNASPKIRESRVNIFVYVCLCACVRHTQKAMLVQ